MGIREALAKVVERTDLTEDEAASAMQDIVAGAATPAQIGAFAVSLRMKGETIDEMAGLARVMRDAALLVETPGPALDTAGTGGDGTLVTDLVTFSLRAVAVQTGEVLGQTSVTKSVTSLKADLHRTKILSTTILDAEFGGAGNEPVGLALRAAIRTALGQLINKGIEDGWWRGLKA